MIGIDADRAVAGREGALIAVTARADPARDADPCRTALSGQIEPVGIDEFARVFGLAAQRHGIAARRAGVRTRRLDQPFGLRLAETLLHVPATATAWNFGPDARGDATVGHVAQRLATLWGQGARVAIPEGRSHPHEAGQLRLDITRARAELGWQPRWSLEDALHHSVAWHRAWRAGHDMAATSQAQIAAYGVAS